MQSWLQQMVAWVDLVKAQWIGNEHTEQEVQELQRELETVLGPLRKEFLVRQGQFREFLKKTMPERIGSLSTGSCLPPSLITSAFTIPFF